MFRKTLFAIILFLMFAPKVSADTQPWVHFMIRVHEPFWDLYFANAQNAGKDLGVKITATFGDDGKNYIFYKNEAKKILSDDQKPDIICFNNFHNSAHQLIELAQYYGVKAILINSDLSKEQKKEVGGIPRVKYDKWIGQILPDDKGTAEKVVNKIIQAAKTKLDQINIVLINGPKKAGAAIGRGAGFETAIKKHPKVKVLQRINLSDWSIASAATKFEMVIRKYPEVNAVFAANSDILSGVVEMAKKAEFEPGTDIFIGGMDIDDNIVKLLENNEIVATGSGHFMEGGFVTVLAYDYLKGKDFASESVSFGSPMIIATPDNILFIKDRFDLKGTDLIDFAQFSKVKNPQYQKYEFNLDQFK
jgi:ABC-type sugar transport system substrate-binding protein